MGDVRSSKREEVHFHFHECLTQPPPFVCVRVVEAFGKGMQLKGLCNDAQRHLRELDQKTRSGVLHLKKAKIPCLVLLLSAS